MSNIDADKWSEARRRALADIAATSDEEDARITAAALADPDAQPWTDEMWARALPYEEYQRRRREQSEARGADTSDAANDRETVQVNLRLDKAVLDHYVAGGEGWQSRMNRALRHAAGLTDTDPGGREKTEHRVPMNRERVSE